MSDRFSGLMYGAPPPVKPGDLTKAADALRESQAVQPPPPYADDTEQRAIAAVVALDDEARARVLRYLVSRFGVEAT